MKFRLVELDSERNILKEYYRSPNVFNEEDFNELKKKCIKNTLNNWIFITYFLLENLKFKKQKIMYCGNDILIQLKIIII